MIGRRRTRPSYASQSGPGATSRSDPYRGIWDRAVADPEAARVRSCRGELDGDGWIGKYANWTQRAVHGSGIHDDQVLDVPLTPELSGRHEIGSLADRQAVWLNPLADIDLPASCYVLWRGPSARTCTRPGNTPR